MPFIPHTEKDIQEMLATIGANSIETLFDEIPTELSSGTLEGVPNGLTEIELTRLMQTRARQDQSDLCFIGAGAYEHHIPAAVWNIVNRGEFLTAYTPYQAEASQGTLQLLYEYQTMMAGLMGLEVSNASLYDGASALAEAVLMAVRANRHATSRRVLIAGSLNPHYRQVVQTIVQLQKIELVELPFDAETGRIEEAVLQTYSAQDWAALVIQQPNFFGVIEDVDVLTDWAHAQNALVIASVNPTATALLKEPGQWGTKGADIACGEGQPLGIPLASGGPYFGFMCCKMEYVRHMPGRIIGRTVDREGKAGFTLTLQAREQHIRRSKATSNICTNQGLLVTAATIYMSLIGFTGLQQVATQSTAHTHALIKKLTNIEGVTRVFTHSYFHEAVIRLPVSVNLVLERLAQTGIQGGYHLGTYYPDLENCLLICATETKSESDLERYAAELATILKELQQKETETKI